MIKSVRAINFQSHKDTLIEFQPGITGLTGDTDAGKSAIIRSMLLVVENSYKETFIRHGEKFVEAYVNDVRRTKTRRTGTNEYQIGDDDPIKVPKRDVPPEVQDHLRLSEINFQCQHDAYFLIQDTPGAVAKKLNQVADLQVITEALKLGKARVKEEKANKDAKSEALEEQELKLEKLVWAEEFEFLLTQAESSSAGYEKLELAISELDSVIDSVQRREKELREFPDTEKILESKKIAKDSVDLLGSFNVEALTSMIKAVEDNVTKLPDTSGDIEKLKGELPKLDFSSIGILDKLVGRVLETNVTIPDTSEDLINLSEVLVKLQEPTNDTLQPLIEEVKNAKLDLNWFPETVISADVSELEKIIESLKVVEDLLSDIEITEDQKDFAETGHRKCKLEYDSLLKETGHCPLCKGVL